MRGCQHRLRLEIIQCGGVLYATSYYAKAATWTLENNLQACKCPIFVKYLLQPMASAEINFPEQLGS
jgi:hypothetical protein